jgi:hypothetical protein
VVVAAKDAAHEEDLLVGSYCLCDAFPDRSGT